MPFKKSLHTSTAFAALALSGAMMLALAGCGGNDTPPTSPPPPPPPPATAPLAEITPISQCIVNSENDVVIGGSNAKKGCDDVVMHTAKVSKTTFDEIKVASGGTLKIETGGANDPGSNGVISSDSNQQALNNGDKIHEICIMAGGVVTAGSKDKPVTAANKIVVTFVGKRGSELSDKTCPADFHKGIDVMKGGSLLLYGAKGVPDKNGNGGVSWTTLAAPAGSQVPGAKVPSTGPKILKLTADVSKGMEGWQKGDWIVVATTDYDPFHSEFVQIETVKPVNKDGVGSIVTLNKNEPLKYYHFGSLPPSPATETCPTPFGLGKDQPAFLCDGADRNWGVDERAEVGLISRDIVLTAATETAPTVAPASSTPSVFWGGEIAIHQGFEQVAIQGVRLSKFGKDKLGSYPIHFHMVGTIGESPNPADQSALINADSIDHSYNHCVTIHSTSNLKISNLVCARIVGHIFYEELMDGVKFLPPPTPPDPGTVNPAADADIVFDHDLGIGAMSNSFDIYSMGGQKRQDLIDKYWWAGDYMTNAECKIYKTCINYYGFNVPDTDNWRQTTHGSCFENNNKGQLINAAPPNRESPTAACPPNPATFPNTSKRTVYVEPASGFWIQNPDTVLTDNAIAGCQGDGVAYWWVPPASNIKVKGPNDTVNLTLTPLGKVDGDRASACYHAYFAEGENGVASGQLQTAQNGENTNGIVTPNIIAHFTNLTASRNRWRALWLRSTSSAIVVKNGHFAGDNRGATLITSGGIDGNAPGVWHMITDSVFVGLSQNNVGRWGPCPKTQALGPDTGFDMGCIAYSHPQDGAAHSAEILGKGYPGPGRNSYGFQIYDGPTLIFHDRFVNYNYNSAEHPATVCNVPGATPDPTTCAFSAELDNADREALGAWHTWQVNHPDPNNPYTQYEGDAALGWFPANQNAYPTATTTRQLLWVNTNLRHQIFTDHVKIDKTFGDGDKNTSIVDEDGTLSGFGVKLAASAATNAKPVHVFSLNNLPFNAVSNSVDECFSRGAQNEAEESRDSSLISPATMGTLEFANLWPYKGGAWPGVPTSHWQVMTFTRTDQAYKKVNGQKVQFHPAMSLNSRAGRGLWEPRVSNGYVYTVSVAPTPFPNDGYPPEGQAVKGGAGIYKWIDVGVADVLDPNLSATHPFYVLLGIDYASEQNGQIIMPKGDFIVKRGYKTYQGGTFYKGLRFPDGKLPSSNKKNPLFDYFTIWNHCEGRDDTNLGNLPQGGDLKKAGCPAGYGAPRIGTDTPPPQPVTVLQPSTATSVKAFVAKGVNTKHYYYNSDTGYLWLYIVQYEPNAQGPSPIGSCDKDFAKGGKPDPACPDWKNGESFYVCPKNGCIIYTIAVNESDYKPGASAQLPPAYLPPEPTEQNQLVKYGTDTVITADPRFDSVGDPYHIPADGQSCTATQPQ